jgi:hypothetical protein
MRARISANPAARPVRNAFRVWRVETEDQQAILRLGDKSPLNNP